MKGVISNGVVKRVSSLLCLSQIHLGWAATARPWVVRDAPRMDVPTAMIAVLGTHHRLAPRAADHSRQDTHGTCRLAHRSEWRSATFPLPALGQLKLSCLRACDHQSFGTQPPLHPR